MAVAGDVPKSPVAYRTLVALGGREMPVECGALAPLWIPAACRRGVPRGGASPATAERWQAAALQKPVFAIAPATGKCDVGIPLKLCC